MNDIMPDRFKGTFKNIHTNRKAKIGSVEVNLEAKGGFVVEFECGDRWSFTDFSSNWDGTFDNLS